MELTSKQRGWLRKQAHPLQAVLMVGKHGVNESVIRAAQQNLDDHELIKVRFVSHKDEKNDLASTIAQECEAAVVAVIGNTAIIFRPSRDQEKQKIHLPSF